ncbi:MAG TPA: SDR family oxidoreductase [Rhodospirillales bacterium]|jgi:NAD(P)-dependent dehydrogenase (short-subunit alcohol dehydrogenase family)|nr:SDR family oxidoreductase [Rhodospirillales bacterium]HJO69270.1 SDR family oxidoreductase [Rhodospirillales bacterium]
MSEGFSRAALVTGAARRIGRAIALDLARNGWAVAAHYNTSVDAARDLADEATGAGLRVALVQADLASDDEAAGLVSRAADAVGPLTCLVNNASVFELDSPNDSPRAIWDAHIQINLRAPLLLSQAFAAQLDPDIEGNVVNIIDQRVLNLTPHFTSYTLSKAGLWTLTQILALALAPRARVNAVGPGPTLPSARQSQDQFIRQWSQLPLKRPTTPGEIGEAVRFILETPAITGQMIALDSGQHLGWAQAQQGRSEE